MWISLRVGRGQEEADSVPHGRLPKEVTFKLRPEARGRVGGAEGRGVRRTVSARVPGWSSGVSDFAAHHEHGGASGRGRMNDRFTLGSDDRFTLGSDERRNL